MSRVLRSVRKRKKGCTLGAVDVIDREGYAELEVDAQVEWIRSLVPLGLLHIEELLDEEVTALAGERYARQDPSVGGRRHGSNPGTVGLAGQRVPIRVPRIRHVTERELPLRSYEALHGDRAVNDLLLRRVLYGISCRNYAAAAEAIPGAIGRSGSTVSRAFIEASAAKLRELQERDLSREDVVALVRDGKTFAESTMVVALGITMTGETRFLGFVETDTKNEKVLTPFLRSLVERGLDVSQGRLVIVDGGKGLRAAGRKAFRHRALVHRCQWHQRENVVSDVAKREQPVWRQRLQRAYNRPEYDEALAALQSLQHELEDRNPSAAGSLAEGLDETLTLHRLGVYGVLGRSLKTTNGLESINALIEERCAKVDHWQNSRQRHRWLATALLDIEPRLRKVMGYRHLPKLRDALKRELKIDTTTSKKKAAYAIRSRGEFQLGMGLTPLGRSTHRVSGGPHKHSLCPRQFRPPSYRIGLAALLQDRLARHPDTPQATPRGRPWITHALPWLLRPSAAVDTRLLRSQNRTQRRHGEARTVELWLYGRLRGTPCFPLRGTSCFPPGQESLRDTGK